MAICKEAGEVHEAQPLTEGLLTVSSFWGRGLSGFNDMAPGWLTMIQFIVPHATLLILGEVESGGWIWEKSGGRLGPEYDQVIVCMYEISNIKRAWTAVEGHVSIHGPMAAHGLFRCQWLMISSKAVLLPGVLAVGIYVPHCH